MPEPQPDKETKEQWMKRCMPRVIKDGTAKNEKQAYAVCESMWQRKRRQ